MVRKRFGVGAHWRSHGEYPRSLPAGCRNRSDLHRRPCQSRDGLFQRPLWREAELYYHRAIEVDGAYALAHFNLGNLYDERGDRPKALEHYHAALEVHPSYADAHYNIALLYQAINQPLKAVQHWKAYLKLDASSEWSAIARRELEKLRASTILHG